VLVTHQIQYLESCPKILLLKDGKVVVCGDYAEVNKTGFNIKEILDSFNKALQKKASENEEKSKAKADESPKKKTEGEKSKVEETPKKEKEKETVEQQLAIKKQHSEIKLTADETEHPPVSF